MNLKELDKLIESIIENYKTSDVEMLHFYQKKRVKLVKQIWKNVEKGLAKLD